MIAPLIPPELPQSIRFEAIPAGGCEMTVHADSAACEALAARMQIPAVLQLSCRFALRRTGGRAVESEGWLRAAVVLTCVVTLEPFEAVIDEAFAVRFVPAGSEQSSADPEAIDEIPYEDGVLLIGEAAAEQLALALPAFPRGPDTGEIVHEDQQSQNSPLQVLAARYKPV